jgi:hypothetical protein
MKMARQQNQTKNKELFKKWFPQLCAPEMPFDCIDREDVSVNHPPSRAHPAYKNELTVSWPSYITTMDRDTLRRIVAVDEFQYLMYLRLYDEEDQHSYTCISALFSKPDLRKRKKNV